MLLSLRGDMAAIMLIFSIDYEPEYKAIERELLFQIHPIHLFQGLHLM